MVEDNIFLPLLVSGNIFEIEINVDYEQGILSFERPGDRSLVYMDIENDCALILVDGKEIEPEPVYNITGDYYLDSSCIEELMDLEIQYDPLLLQLLVESEHLYKEDQENGQFFPFTISEEEEKEEGTVEPFSLSNITYRWLANREENQTRLYYDEDIESEKSSHWDSALSLNARGTIYDWKYDLKSTVRVEDEEESTIELDRAVLTYDMDRAIFKFGTLHVLQEENLELSEDNYLGFSLGSRVSPLMQNNGNLIQIEGEAETGSTVVLYLNGIKMGTERVASKEKYRFRDIVLFELERANEIKLVIQKPNGQEEEKYRYLAVSDGILNKGEVNYLAQAGRADYEGMKDP